MKNLIKNSNSDLLYFLKARKLPRPWKRFLNFPGRKRKD